MATISEEKNVKKGTEKPAYIGTLMAVTEEEEDTPMRVKANTIRIEEDSLPESDTQVEEMKVKKEV